MTSPHDRTWWRHLSGWRRQAVVLLLATVGSLVLLGFTAAPAQAVGTGSAPTVPFTDPDPGLVATAVRILLIAATTVVAGAGSCRVLVGASVMPAVSVAARRIVRVAAAVAVLAAVTAGLLGQASPSLAVAQVIVTVAVAVTLPRVSWVAPAALVLLVLLVLELGAGSSGVTAAIAASYALGAALLSGSSLLMATGAVDGTDSRIGRAVTRRLGRVAVGAGVVVTGAGVAHLVVRGPHTAIDLFLTGFGLASLTAIVLPLVVTGAWLSSRSRVIQVSRLAEGGGPGLPAAPRISITGVGRFGVIGVVIAIGAVSLLATLPPPAGAPLAGRPLLRPVTLPGEELSLLVSPGLPGRNLVRLSGGPAGHAPMQAPMDMPADAALHGPHAGSAGSAPLSISAGGVPVPVTDRAGASGRWAVLDIPAGTRQLRVSRGALSVPVPVNVGNRAGGAEQEAMQAALVGPDGPECADAVLGALLAGTAEPLPSACPAQRLDPADAQALRLVVDSLADRGVRSLVLAEDPAPRSTAAATLVRAEATRRGLVMSSVPDADSAVVVVSGWEQAVGTLRDISQRAAVAPTATAGIYLAPWLLTGNVINAVPSAVLPLRFNPQEVGPRQYAATLAAVFPDSVPSQAGYTSWARATRSAAGQVVLYGAAPVNVPMGMAMQMGAGPGQWFPGGAIVPISPPLTDS